MSDTNGFVVEKGVPMPHGAGRRSDYPFGKMEVGDSFMLQEHTVRKANSVRASAHSYEIKNVGTRFTIRKTPDGNYHCWRVS